jgi:hypothetical protein
MEQNRFGSWLFLAVVVLWSVHGVAGEPLEEAFRQPPDSARPWVWYRWHGVVDREGIRRDLDTMKSAGISGFVLDFSDSEPVLKQGISRDIEFVSPEFFDLFYYLLEEAAQRGLETSVMFQNGWATTGGNWVAPEDREHVLVWDEAPVAGPGLQTLRLMPPLRPDAFYRDIRVFAMPVEKAPPVTAFRRAGPKVTADTVGPNEPEGAWNADPKFLIDGNPGSFLALDAHGGKKAPIVTLEFDKPFSAEALYLHPGATFGMSVLGNAQCSLWVSDDGTSFRKVHSFSYSPVQVKGRSGATFPLPERVTGRFFRFQIDKIPWPHNAWLAELELLQAGESPSTLPRTPFIDSLSGGVPGSGLSRPAIMNNADWPEEESTFTTSGRTVDLTDDLKPDGSLRWNVPDGNWLVVRLGYAESGSTASAQAFPSDGSPWEANKFSAEGAQAYMSGFLQKVLNDPRAAPFLGTTLKGAHIDSWECSHHRWSEAVPAWFDEHMPYRLEDYYPALLGFTVNSVEETRRFLFDYRRALADMTAENFIRTVADKVQAAGLFMEMEFTHRDRMKSWKYCDRPMTEFSPKGDHGGAGRLPEGIMNNVKMTASAAHVYGRPIVSSEAFLAWDYTFQPDHITARLGGGDDGVRKFDRDPFALKSSSDKAFAQGVNHLVFHLFSHQPFGDRLPGITTRYGTNFGRNLIWWPFAHAWTEYLTRCQFLLQQGQPVMDFLFCMSEDAYSVTGLGSLGDRRYQYDPGSGYDFDLCTGQMLIDRVASVENGRIVLKDGTSYSMLVVGSLQKMTFPLLEKLASLVEQGAIMLASHPTGSPSLADLVAGTDPKFTALAKELWGDINGSSVKKNNYGKGNIFWGCSIAEALREIGVEPAMTSTVPTLEFMQRRAGSDDLFFLSTQSDDAVTAECSFGITGKTPELWHPDSGRIERAVAREENGRTLISIDFPPNGSVFVVFREQPTSGAEAPIAQLESVAEITGPWQVSFVSPFGEKADKIFDRLDPWRASDDRFVKYFSGVAVYTKSFSLQSEIINRKSAILLDLGDVWNMAQVTVNGKTFPPLWKPPFRVDISEAVRAGENELQIEVVNTWVNRIIGDLNLPQSERKTWLTINPHTKNSPLRPAGLLGPVRLLVEQSKDTH